MYIYIYNREVVLVTPPSPLPPRSASVPPPGGTVGMTAVAVINLPDEPLQTSFATAAFLKSSGWLFSLGWDPFITATPFTTATQPPFEWVAQEGSPS